MKRCPQCLFIYPESDTRCDFDNTSLVVVDDAEIESATSQAPAPVAAKKKRAAGSKKVSRKKGKAISAAAALVFGLAGFFVYFRLSQSVETVAEIAPVASASVAPVVAPQVATVCRRTLRRRRRLRHPVQKSLRIEQRRHTRARLSRRCRLVVQGWRRKWVASR